MLSVVRPLHPVLRETASLREALASVIALVLPRRTNQALPQRQGRLFWGHRSTRRTPNWKHLVKRYTVVLDHPDCQALFVGRDCGSLIDIDVSSPLYLVQPFMVRI